MAMMAFSMPGPERRDEGQRQDQRGNDRKMSVIRISTVSTQPPK